jgi:hypothetical protein
MYDELNILFNEMWIIADDQKFHVDSILLYIIYTYYNIIV